MPEAKPQPPSTRLVTMLERSEAASLVEWLAASVRAGEVRVEAGDGERGFALAENLRAQLSAEQRVHGGTLKLRIEWEDPGDVPFGIEPV